MPPRLRHRLPPPQTPGPSRSWSRTSAPTPPTVRTAPTRPTLPTVPTRRRAPTAPRTPTRPDRRRTAGALVPPAGRGLPPPLRPRCLRRQRNRRDVGRYPAGAALVSCAGPLQDHPDDQEHTRE